MIRLVLVVLLAMPASAAEVEAVHPLHFSDLSSTAHPFWQQVSLQTNELAHAMSPVEVEAALQTASAQGPAARLAAAALARAQVDPAARAALVSLMPDQDRGRALAAVIERLPAARDDPASPIRQLSALSQTEPALRRVFDGEKFPGLGLESVSVGGRGLKTEAGRLPVLGQGSFGVVHDHPAVPGAVVKAVAISFEAALLNLDAEPGQVAAQEERTARTLERAGAGPRYMGRTLIDGAPVSVREKIYGSTMSTMIRERRFTKDDAALVLSLAARVAAAGILPNDLKPANIMVGRTLLDPERRAYVVDGGVFVKEDQPVSVDEVLDLPVVLGGGFNKDVGYVETTTTLNAAIARGLHRSRPTTRWQRFVEAWFDAMNPMRVPM